MGKRRENEDEVKYLVGKKEAEFKALLAKAKKEEKPVRFFIHPDFWNKIAPNVKLLYRQDFNLQDPLTHMARFHNSYIKFRHGVCETDDPEKIAFLDLQEIGGKKSFCRKADLPLTEEQELKVKLGQMQAELDHLRSGPKTTVNA